MALVGTDSLAHSLCEADYSIRANVEASDTSTKLVRSAAIDQMCAADFKGISIFDIV